MFLQKEFQKFQSSRWGLELWLGDRPIFRSEKSGVNGLLDFIRRHGRRYKDFVIFDKIVGRGAALLSAYLKAKAVYAAMGSGLAAKALKKYKIKFYFKKTVQNILNRGKTDLCPFEKLSLDKTPKEFYDYLRK